MIRLTLNFLTTSSSSSNNVNSGMLPRPPALSVRRSGESSMLMVRSSSFGTSFIPRRSAPKANPREGLRDDILSDALCADAATPHHTTTVLRPFFRDHPGQAGARRELLDFMVQEKINRGRHTDHPTGRHSIRTNQCPPPPSPLFTGRMPFLPPNQQCQNTEGN